MKRASFPLARFWISRQSKQIPTRARHSRIIPDSELVYGPASAQFDLTAFVQNQGGYLANYVQDVDGESLSGIADYYACCAKLFGQPAFAPGAARISKLAG